MRQCRTCLQSVQCGTIRNELERHENTYSTVHLFDASFIYTIKTFVAVSVPSHLCQSHMYGVENVIGVPGGLIGLVKILQGVGGTFIQRVVRSYVELFATMCAFSMIF